MNHIKVMQYTWRVQVLSKDCEILHRLSVVSPCMVWCCTLRYLLNKLARITVFSNVKQASSFNRDLRVMESLNLMSKYTFSLFASFFFVRMFPCQTWGLVLSWFNYFRWFYNEIWKDLEYYWNNIVLLLWQ